MALPVDRRTFLGTTAAGALLSCLPVTFSAAAAGLEFGPRRDMSFESLVEQARALAQAAYAPPLRPDPEIIQQIDYDAHGKIRFKPDLALFASGEGVYPATFFHLGRFFPNKVTMYALEDGQAAEIRYLPGYFDMPEDSVARGLPEDVGFAGFRFQESRARDDWKTQDWVAFLGASYFRAIGELGQYGLSARGIAIDTAISGPEEFPDFTEFYIAPATSDSEPATLLALLNGPSVAGAYRFKLWRTAGVVMEVEAELFLRRDVQRFGVAPLTSMFWYAEQNRNVADDWRPEVHDSEGLALWTGAGERLWRPLNNPPQTVTSAFADENPRGFGLMQRDRNFEHYLDGVNYDRRPSLWVEPLGDWGQGSVELIEIPTDDEIHDNIGAFWVPAEPARAGDAYRFAYRLHWLADEPYPAADLARCVATRRGRGGEPGKPRVPGIDKFVVEFAGGALPDLAADAEITPDIDASRGEVSYVFVEPVPHTDRWRLQFDLTADGSDPVELRAYLRAGDRPLTETWLYQHHLDAAA
jgi:glucans biosynthesis protein